MEKVRCEWARNSFPEYEAYHDHEWGVSVHDDQTHFEFLILEGAQAGLSWSTVLKKREGYRRIFHHFKVEEVAKMGENEIAEALLDPGIIRNKLKVRSAVINALNFLEVQAQYGSFDRYIWSFVEGKPIVNHWQNLKEVPATTAKSDRLSKDLQKKGFKFVGSTIIYAHMQACGLVNDHTIDCFRHQEVIT